jgi:isopentenyl diphosphate isomerase/L-lactate dehydrogenase-like FMN-dependent dehydrogenase
VTIDSAVYPTRERDYRNKLTIPLRLSPSLLITGLLNPIWAKDFILGKVGRSHGLGQYRAAIRNLTNVARDLKPVTADDVRWIRDQWPGKLVLKGVMRGDECARMVDLGVDGIVVSNHGGRNLDGVRATIEILPEVVSAVKGRAEVFLDGGVRRGTDVLKAIALGARACLVGRPYMFGLAAGGEAGVARTLEIFRKEIDQAMGLIGCATVADLDASYVSSVGNAMTIAEPSFVSRQ